MDRLKLRTRNHSSYRLLIGVGGIGSGLCFALEGNHDLGRNESRPARLVHIRDYCKLHIITHYLAVLLGADASGSSFHILPLGKVGNDSEGQRLLKEMTAIGLDTKYVETVEGKPTLFSICYQYPDRTGGNITTSGSAAASLTNNDIDRVIPLLEACGSSSIILAVPEVPLEVRHHLLKLATTHQPFRVASFTSTEILEAQKLDIFRLVDLLAINEDEAAALMGQAFDPNKPRLFLEQCAVTLTASQPRINIVISAGKAGVFAFAGDQWSHFPALPVQAVNTMGAGDALLAGLLAALIAGRPLISHSSPTDEVSGRALGSAIDFGILLASFSVTSPHTIHPQASIETLLDFARELGVTFTEGLSQIFTKDDLNSDYLISGKSQESDESHPSLKRGSPLPLSAARAAKRLLRPLKNELVQLLQHLVQMNTVATPPDGSETEAQKVLHQFLKNYDLDVERYPLSFLSRSKHAYVRHERHYAGRQNLIARLSGNGRGRSLLISGHMDTVPPGPEPWKESPWSGAIRRGRLYGRGSYDMKGGLVAGFAVAIALKKAGLRLGGDLLCESVVDEEWAGGGGTLAARLRGDIADACVIPEPTDLSIFRASRGGYFVDINVAAGDPQSYFSKDEVISPAIPMGRLLGWIDSWSSKRREIARGEAYSGFSDPAPVQVLALEANRFAADIPWSVPLMARVRVYFQFLPHEDVAEVIEEVQRSFRSFCEQDPFFSIYQPEWKAIIDPPLLGHELPIDHEWTQSLHRSATAALGTAPPLTAAEYPCDAFINQRYFGIPTLIFGPRGAGPHNINEYVEVRSVLQTAAALITTALEWCNA